MRRIVLLAALCLFGAPVLRGTEIFSTNSVWRFRRGLSEASSPVTAWRAVAFNDAAAGFTNAPAPFWYGDVRPGGTQLTDMQNSYSCVFLRHAFTIGEATNVSSLRLQASVDDGFIAWINGVEVARTNVTGQPTYQTLAADSPEPVPFVTYTLPAPSGYLTTGTNVLTIQAFNTMLNSSDFGFDCLLDVTLAETNPPTIANVEPAPGTVSNLTSIAVTWSEPVIGIQPTDFLVNSVAAVGASANGNTWTFTFPQPLYGAVNITWASGHGIADLATPSNPFDALAPGATWQYTLIDGTPPTVTALFPVNGAVLQLLSQIEITFSESIAGVQASDLLINGQPATNLMHLSGNLYVFGFAPPAAGVVSVAWDPGHGITDVATAPNAFGGGAWSYAVDPNVPAGDLLITEILAANVSTNGLADEDVEQQDWIEIYNRGTDSINLANWSLSDDPELPGFWTFPARTIAPGQFLVVFASGKDRRSTNSADNLHTNFKLSDAGESLGLYTPDSPRVLVSGFAPFPEQRNDISYGLDPDGVPRYFATPTPGAPNGPSTIVGVCAPVHVNVSRGHFTTPFDLFLSCATPDVALRYTMDGSDPTGSSPLFPAFLRLTNTTLLRTAAFKTNHLSSKTVTHSYFFNLSAALRSLPVISIVTGSNNLYGPSGIIGIQGGFYDPNQAGLWVPTSTNDYHNPSEHGLAWERPASMEWIRPEDNSGFQIDCGLRVQGSDYRRPRLTPASKISFRAYFRGDYGPNRLDYPLFPLTSVHRFQQLVLRGGFDDQDNPFIRDEIHRRLAHDTGQIASRGTMAIFFLNGVFYTNSPYYNPCERVHEEFFQEHLGGGDDWDVIGPPTGQSSDGPGIIDGDRFDFQDLVSYVQDNTVTSQTVYSNISRRLDLTNFADYLIVNTYGAMGDWPHNNFRAGRDQATNGIWRFVIWDAEYGMGLEGNVFNNNFGSIGTWTEIGIMYQKLKTSPEFKLLWADRVQKHFFNGGALTKQNVSNRFEELRAELSAVLPGMSTVIPDWVRDRQPIFFNQMNTEGLLSPVAAPGFNQFGGRVPAGFNLIITNVTGTIYYTTNGNDPREPFTGAISPSAIAYTGPIPLNSSVTVRARARLSTTWSAINEATFTAGSLGVPLRFTEIMYNPIGGSIYEFLELQNTGLIPVDLSGMYLDGVAFQFNEGTSLAGGARLVLGSNTDTNSWKTFYTGVTPFGWFGGNLNNGGERLALFDRFGNTITSVDYKDSGGWPAAADGAGRSLECLDPAGDPDAAANWQASTANNGTPGAANSAPPAQPVFLNELMAENFNAVSNGSTFPDWIELRNPGAGPVNLNGWSLTDDGNARKFVFPNTNIAAFSHLVIWCDATTNTTPGLHAGFSLDQDGETVSLYNTTTNRVDAITYGLQLTNYSAGRISGNWTLTTPTPNATNAAATLASVTNLAINEWLANPAPGSPDWIELFNRSAGAPVSLQGVYLATSNTLQQLTALSFLPPLGYVQLFADEGVGADHLDFKLPAGGDALILSDPTGAQVQTITYGGQTEAVSQGRLPDGNASIVNFPGSVSPEAANYTNNYGGPVINEVLARNRLTSVGGEFVDWIELFNPTGTNFNLGGMSLSVSSADPGEWIFPAGTTIGVNGHLLIKCDGASPVSTNAGDFNIGESLDGDSGGVYLFNTSGQLVYFVEHGPQVEDLSIGLSGGQWRLLSAPTPGAANAAPAVLGAGAALRLNEWMAAPMNGADWFEVHNTTNQPVDLSTISLSDDPSIAGESKFLPAPLSFIGANGFVKWVADASAGQGRDHVNFALDGDGDSILLYNHNGTNFTFLDAVAFGKETSGVSRGSLPDGMGNAIPFPGSPSPGESNYRLLTNVFISEALAHTDPPLEDAIELFNPTASPVSIGGWFLSNSRIDRHKFQVPGGTTIPAGGRVVIYEYQFNDGTTNAFTLNSAHGDEIWLSAAAGSVETGDRGTVQFGASFNGVSFGRIVTSAGVDFVPLVQRTFGADNPLTLTQFRTGTGLSNAAPIIGPVAISEMFYHPPGGTNGSDEFIELHNHSGGTVPLYDPAYPTNHWKFAGGIDYTFPSGVSLAAGEFLLVVGFDPATSLIALVDFRARYNVPTNVAIYGPFDGALDNAEDSVELYRPDTPQQPPAPDAGFVPYVLADRVSYADAAPWPAGLADGGGHSLQRLGAVLYGNEPLNWFAGAPTAGSANATLVDTDGDGIPDLIELQLGLDPNNAADGAADFDGDGMSNYAEYIAGTDLNSSASKLTATITPQPIDLLRLEWTSVPGRSYRLVSSTDLLNWTPLTSWTNASGSTISFVLSPTGASTMYRVEVTQ